MEKTRAQLARLTKEQLNKIEKSIVEAKKEMQKTQSLSLSSRGIRQEV